MKTQEDSGSSDEDSSGLVAHGVFGDAKSKDSDEDDQAVGDQAFGDSTEEDDGEEEGDDDDDDESQDSPIVSIEGHAWTNWTVDKNDKWVENKSAAEKKKELWLEYVLENGATGSFEFPELYAEQKELVGNYVVASRLKTRVKTRYGVSVEL